MFSGGSLVKLREPPDALGISEQERTVL